MSKIEKNPQMQFIFEQHKGFLACSDNGKVVCFQQAVSARNAEKEREVLARIHTAYKRYKW